jgi:hypothetical protein
MFCQRPGDADIPLDPPTAVTLETTATTATDTPSTTPTTSQPGTDVPITSTVTVTRAPAN